MSKRPIRVTLSMTPDEYDRLCWLAFYWKENPSTAANSTLQEAIERKMGASQELQKRYAEYRKTMAATVGGGRKKEEEKSGTAAPTP